MLPAPDWSLGDRYLRANVPELAPLVERYSPCPLRPQPQESFFSILLSGIVAQQLPPAVSQQLMSRLEGLLGRPVLPGPLAAASAASLRQLGLSQQKIDYAQGFASACLSGLIDMAALQELPDSAILKQLLKVRGLGQWTIEMFLLLGLCRPDVVPSADFIFKRELKLLLNLPEIPKRGLINQLTQGWRPWRSLAVWYLWQHADAKNRSGSPGPKG